jgi:peptidyl-tRNA hydrolase
MFDAYDNKGKFVAQVNERIDNIALVFKKGNEVMVSSGADMGKQGIVVDVSGQHTTIITRNNHQLRVLTQALTHIYDRVKPDLPIIKLCKYDLVKYQ